MCEDLCFPGAFKLVVRIDCRGRAWFYKRVFRVWRNKRIALTVASAFESPSLFAFCIWLSSSFLFVGPGCLPRPHCLYLGSHRQCRLLAVPIKFARLCCYSCCSYRCFTEEAMLITYLKHDRSWNGLNIPYPNEMLSMMWMDVQRAVI